MAGRAWQATVHGVAKSWTQLSDFTLRQDGLIGERKQMGKEQEESSENKWSRSSQVNRLDMREAELRM